MTVENEYISQKEYVAILNQAVILKRLGKIDHSIELVKKAIYINPYRELAYYNLGKLLHIKKKFNESINSYIKALEFGYDEKEVLKHLGFSILANNASLANESIDFTTNTNLFFYELTINPFHQKNLSRREVVKLHEKYDDQKYVEQEKNAIETAIEFLNNRK